VTQPLDEPTWTHDPSSAPHNLCSGIGRYDCDFVARIDETILDSGAGEGDVEAPVGWFEEITLDALCEGHPDDDSSMNMAAGATRYCDGSCRRGEEEHELAVHFGTPWLIARQDTHGFFWALRYASPEERDDDLEFLRDRFEGWEGGQ
jgi:hypothetical protein